MSQTAGVILAAGKGTRMNSDDPKVLHKICGQPLLYYVIEAAKEAEITPLYAVVGYGSDKVEKAFKKESVSWVLQSEQCGTGHALSVTSPSLAGFDGTLVVLCGDAPLITPETIRKLIKLHETNKDTVATILTTIVDDPASYGRIIRNETGQVIAIVENNLATPEEKKIKEINSGIYAFNARSVFDTLKKIKPNPKNGEYQLTDVISLFVRSGKRVEAFLINESSECLGINSREELINASKIMSKRIQDKLIKQGVTIIDPANTYIESDVSIGADTIIYPFTVINSGVKIGSHCEVGPFSHLRSGTILDDHAEIGNFTETKKTKVGKHSKAKHLSYLGDAMIGDNVNIGAGTITANFDGENKYKTIIEDGASTGSGTVLVAPVRMGKDSVTGAGAIVTKGNDIPDKATVVGVPAKQLKKKKSKSK
jgi:bifunctional UDP-N-acetylglucosamine pyrophosphorylase/glucosamine-1-phosphate N-acetyltransferase